MFCLCFILTCKQPQQRYSYVFEETISDDVGSSGCCGCDEVIEVIQIIRKVHTVILE